MKFCPIFFQTVLASHGKPHTFENRFSYVRGHSTTTWPFFDPPPSGQFFYPERGQKQTFLDPLPPHLVHVVIECPKLFFFFQ